MNKLVQFSKDKFETLQGRGVTWRVGCASSPFELFDIRKFGEDWFVFLFWYCTV